ncbi:MAG: hypothetical protein A4E25_01612 [Methanobacterium sp. PtaB.Bin024]|nr:MAG: hypothetical protein A4E25_01612 [Methanobacterium sp. PtaB.Bin024]
MDYKSFFNNNRILIFILSIYLLLGLFFLNYYQYIINADAISYISIANYYINGNYADAINGYWGPLFSWLLVPFLFFGTNPFYSLYSARILSLIIGIFTIVGIRRLSYKFEMEERIRTIIIVSMIPIVLYFALNLFITPDLLVTCLLVYYFSIIFDPEYPNNPLNGVSCALIGVLAYLAKSYVFPFFLIHFTLFNIYYYFKGVKVGKRKNVVKTFVLGISIFLVISGVWVGLISQKYGHVTVGTAGEYNEALVGPGAFDHPMLYQGIIQPPNENAVSAWEDPSYIKISSWSPFESVNTFNHQLGIISENILKIIYYFEVFSILSILIIVASLIMLIKKPLGKSNQILGFSLATIFLYSVGYCLILVEDRYLWVVYIILMLMGGYLINVLFKTDLLNNWDKNFLSRFKLIILIVFVLSFMLLPVSSLLNDTSSSNSPYDAGRTLFSLTDSLDNYNVSGRIASDDKWHASLYLSYYLNSKYYGKINQSNSMDLQNELEKNNIDYYFVWNNPDDVHLSHYKDITGDRLRFLNVFKRVKNG